MAVALLFVVTLAILWVLLILPQQRRIRAHQQLVMSLQEGDDVVLTAGIFGRIVRLGPEELDLEVAPGVTLRVARQAVLRRVIDAPPAAGRGPVIDVAGDAPRGALDVAAGPEVDTGDGGDNNADRPDGGHHAE